MGHKSGEENIEEEVGERNGNNKNVLYMYEAPKSR